jgi:hypothetical protein
MLYDRLHYQYKDKLEMVDDIYPTIYKKIMQSLNKDYYLELTISEGQDLCQFILGENVSLGSLQKLFTDEKNKTKLV